MESENCNQLNSMNHCRRTNCVVHKRFLCRDTNRFCFVFNSSDCTPGSPGPIQLSNTNESTRLQYLGSSVTSCARFECRNYLITYRFRFESHPTLFHQGEPSVAVSCAQAPVINTTHIHTLLVRYHYVPTFS